MKEEISFTLRKDSDYGVVANFRPWDDDESLPSRLPAGVGYDECVVGGWTFPKELDTPAKIAQDLVRRGFAWDSGRQKEADPALTTEIATALAPPKARRPAPKL